MIYLKSIEIVKAINNLKAGYTIPDLKDINYLVGDQGSGKSTMLGLLSTNDKDYVSADLSEDARIGGVTSYFFDSEKDNPRTRDPELYTKPNGENLGIGFCGALVSRFQSHGECLVDFTVNGINKASDCVLIFDEPENGLSIRNQFRLAKAFNDSVSRGCQVFVATHCLPLIESQDEVFSMEHDRWVRSGRFIATQEGEE